MKTTLPPIATDRSLDVLAAMDAQPCNFDMSMRTSGGGQGANIMNALVSLMAHQQPVQTPVVTASQDDSSSGAAVAAGLGVAAVGATAIGCAVANSQTSKAPAPAAPAPQSAQAEKSYTPKWTVTSVKDGSPAG